jgi:hypothetical protein
MRQRILTIAIVATCISCKESAWTPMGSADLVLSQIKLGGGAAVGKRIDTDPTFAESVMSGISSGDSAWIEVARQLAPTSAAAEASLSIALATALPKAPRRVLPLLRRRIPLEEVCGIPFLEADSGEIVRYSDSTVAALGAVRDSTLVGVRDKCTTALHDARTIKLSRIDPSYIVKNKPTPAPRRTRRR